MQAALFYFTFSYFSCFGKFSIDFFSYITFSLFFPFFFFHILSFCVDAFINLQLSTVPVSTRAYLWVEKVQSCRPALLSLVSVMSSSCCSDIELLCLTICVNLLYQLKMGSCGLCGSKFSYNSVY